MTKFSKRPLPRQNQRGEAKASPQSRFNKEANAEFDEEKNYFINCLYEHIFWLV